MRCFVCVWWSVPCKKWTNRSSCRLGVADLPTGPRNHVLVGNPDPQTENDFRGHVSDIGQSQQTARSRGVTPRQCRLSLPLLQQLVKVSSVYGTTVTKRNIQPAEVDVLPTAASALRHLPTSSKKKNKNKKLRYRRRTAWRNVSVKILPTAEQQCGNNLYDKSIANRSNGVRRLQSTNV